MEMNRLMTGIGIEYFTCEAGNLDSDLDFLDFRLAKMNRLDPGISRMNGSTMRLQSKIGSLLFRGFRRWQAINTW